MKSAFLFVLHFILLIAIIGVMLFCSGLSVWYFLAIAVLLVLACPLLWDLLQPYQQERILYGFRPELDPQNVGRQPLLSRETIAGGGFFGIGLFGKGTYEDLPASHTDFIFSTVCEKFGFVGGFLVVTALVIMALAWIPLSGYGRSVDLQRHCRRYHYSDSGESLDVLRSCPRGWNHLALYERGRLLRAGALRADGLGAQRVRQGKKKAFSRGWAQKHINQWV